MSKGRIGGLNRDDGACLRYGLWTIESGQGRGTVVIFPGRTEFIEKYEEVIGELMARGYSVAILDWRNHGLSSRPLKNVHKHHLSNFAVMIEDAAAFFEMVVKPSMPGPFYGLGHSMGGHCLLRFVHDHPEALRAVVLTAPMIGIHLRRLPPWIARFVVRLYCMIGLGRRYAFGQGDYGMVQGTEQVRRLLTSDTERYERDIAHIRKNPDLALGGVTYGWLNAAFRSMDLLARPAYAEMIETPVFVVAGGRDRIVDNHAIERFVRRLPHGSYVEVDDARHEILSERDELREQFWAVFDRFMAEHGEPPRAIQGVTA